jgi:hypothetical protein
MIFVGTKTRRTKKNVFPLPFFLAAVGSGIRDPGSEIRDPGWIKIRIRDEHPGSATLNINICGVSRSEGP